MQTLDGQVVLVTGASGFLGGHLIARIKTTGAKIYAVSRQIPQDAGPGEPVQWVQADVTNAQYLHDLVTRIQPDVIYHLASCGQGGQDVLSVLPNFENDLQTTVNILLAARASGCKRVVLVASLEEPTLDGRPILLSSPYAAAKACCTLYGRLFHQIYGVPVTIVRPFMVYGPGQKAHKIIPYTIQSLLQGDSPRLSSGTRPVDWVYVEDVITAFIEVAVRPEASGEMIDLGSGKLASVRDVIEEIHRLIPGSPAPGFGALPDRVQEVVRCADTETAWRILGWRASTSITEGMARTIDHYRKQAAKQCTPA